MLKICLEFALHGTVLLLVYISLSDGAVLDKREIQQPNQVKNPNMHLGSSDNQDNRQRRSSMSNQVGNGKCKWQSAECESTYSDQCCDGMRCTDIFGGYCMGRPFQKCVCVPEFYGHY